MAEPRQKLQVGPVLRRAGQVYARWAAMLIPAALVFHLIPLAVAVGLRDIGGLGGVLIEIVTALLSLAATCWIGGVAVKAVQAFERGNEEPSLGAALAAIRPVLLKLVGATFLTLVFVGVGLIFLLVPGLLFLARLSLIVPVVVVEGGPVTTSLSRSNELVEGSTFRVLLVVLLVVVATIGIQQLFLFGSPPADDIGTQVAGLFASALTDPMLGILAAVMYFRLAPRPQSQTGAALPTTDETTA
ncbi:MAG: hypothetical protein QOJ38_80 [Solirubrobacterales bacterium]|jgi:hypothetical protein|nr:hypothetical protein [Solirubrobacterales bacterium]